MLPSVSFCVAFLLLCVLEKHPTLLHTYVLFILKLGSKRRSYDRMDTFSFFSFIRSVAISPCARPFHLSLCHQLGFCLCCACGQNCIHCHALLADFSRAATFISGVRFGVVDCTGKQAFADAEGLQHYPTLRLFVDGHKAAFLDLTRTFWVPDTDVCLLPLCISSLACYSKPHGKRENIREFDFL